jgi:iron complex transport system substrate-binding protein
MHQPMRSLVPPALLILLVVAIAGAVHTYASPQGGLQLPVLNREDGDARIRIGKTQYPREAVDSDEVTVRIARPAHRIVSQYWSIDELVYSVLPPEDVVAVSQTAYAEEISNVYQTVQRFKPAVATDPERVVALNPDLMFISSDGRADYTSLARSSGIPVYRMHAVFETLDQIEQNIRLVGYLTGQDENAAKEASRFHAAIEEAVSLRPPGSPKPRILGLGGRYSYGRKTLFQDIVTRLGGINVGAENGLVGYDSVNFEQIIRWNPEWIVAGAKTGNTKQVLAALMSDPAISLTQAARNGHIVVVDNRIFLPMSPYTSALVQAIAQAIYGAPREKREGKL